MGDDDKEGSTRTKVMEQLGIEGATLDSKVGYYNIDAFFILHWASFSRHDAGHELSVFDKSVHVQPHVQWLAS